MTANQWSNTFVNAPAAAAQKSYDDVLVPGMFVPWANKLLDKLKPSSGEAALDVASGTGAVARLLAERVGPDGRVVAADISPGMLEISKSKGTVPGGAAIEFVETPAAPLAVPSAEFDVVTCQHGFQFFPDKPAALAEMKRALRPGGRVGVAIWDSIDGMHVFKLLRDLVQELIGGDAGARYEAGPWGYPGAEFKRVFEASGLSDVEVVREQMEAEFPSPRALADSLGAAVVAQELRDMEPSRREAFLDHATARVEKEFGRDGKAFSLTTAWIATARA